MMTSFYLFHATPPNLLIDKLVKSCIHKNLKLTFLIDRTITSKYLKRR